jgi:hypothetical protein
MGFARPLVRRRCTARGRRPSAAGGFADRCGGLRQAVAALRQHPGNVEAAIVHLVNQLQPAQAERSALRRQAVPRPA